MPNRDGGPRPGGGGEKPQAFMMVLTLLSFVLLVGLAFLFSNSLDSLEEKLAYQAPATADLTRQGAYDIDFADGQTVYVPVYSHIYADGGRPHLLEATLSVRNVDPNNPIALKSVKYFDTQGTLIKEYLDEELAVAALATASFLVEKRDIRGGSGANFIVVWDAEKPVYEPLIEAVMVGFADANSIAFTSPGRALVERQE